MMEFTTKTKVPRIKILGIGGGGSNAVNHMFRNGIVGAEFAVCNTDIEALQKSSVPIKIQLGSSLVEGGRSGSISNLDVKETAESIEEINRFLFPDTNMLILVAGLGGGTGSSAISVIAKIAKEKGILTVAIVSFPFLFEGKKRKQQADIAFDELLNNTDTIISYANDNLRKIYGNLSLADAFSKSDEIVYRATKGLVEIITLDGYINTSFEAIQSIFRNRGVGIMGIGTATGENRSIVAIESALASPLLSENNVKGAKAIVCSIKSGSPVLLDEVGMITDYLQEEAGLQSDIICGNSHDVKLNNEIEVIVIATGFGFNQKNEFNEERKIYDLNDNVNEGNLERQLAASRKRIEKLKNLNYRIGPENLIKGSEAKSKKNTLSLYFLKEEFNQEEIANILSLLSDFYREVGGDKLVIKGMNAFEFVSILEPLEV